MMPEFGNFRTCESEIHSSLVWTLKAVSVYILISEIRQFSGVGHSPPARVAWGNFAILNVGKNK